MKSQLTIISLLCFLAVASVTAQNQYKINFSYDNAGNQTNRDWVCINCTTTAVDTTKVEDIDLSDISDIEEDIERSTIIAYPNPVTNLLTLDWQHNKKEVSQIVVFSGIGQQLLQRSVKSKQGSINLDFTNYQQGLYFIHVFYTDKTKKTFNVIKK